MWCGVVWCGIHCDGTLPICDLSQSNVTLCENRIGLSLIALHVRRLSTKMLMLSWGGSVTGHGVLPTGWLCMSWVSGRGTCIAADQTRGLLRHASSGQYLTALSQLLSVLLVCDDNLQAHCLAPKPPVAGEVVITNE